MFLHLLTNFNKHYASMVMYELHLFFVTGGKSYLKHEMWVGF